MWATARWSRAIFVRVLRPALLSALRPALLAALLGAVFGLSSPAGAQAPLEIRLAAPGEVQELRLADGSALIGRLVDAGEPIRFELASGGVVEVRRTQVRGLRAVEGEIHDGELWARDPSDNRLFFGPTGRTVGAGKGYLAVFEAFFPSVSVGLSERVTMGGGTLLVGDLGENHPFWLVPKVKVVDQERAAVSVGALAITALENGWAGILYGVGTFGPPDQSLTLGVGYGWIDDDLADRPAILVGGESRVASGVKLITENYLIPGGDGYELLLSAGPRFFGERLSADLGIAVLASGGGGGFFPLVNFVYNW